MRTCAELLVECLENEGVERVFGVPGEEVIDLLDALSRSSIQFISTRHEQGAAFMADAHGRFTGQAGVCLATLGPGATNLITGVADATLDHAPLVAITGQTPLTGLRREAHQYVDLSALFRPVVKWEAAILDPKVTAEVVRGAFRAAQTEKPGSAYVELPENVASAPAEGRPLRASEPPVELPNGIELESASRLLEQARRPMILAGHGVQRALAAPALRDFVHRLQIPVVETFMGKGNIDPDDPLFLGTIGVQAMDGAQCALEEADLVLAIGYDPVEYAPRYWNPHADKTIVHIARTPAEADRFYQPAVEVVGAISVALDAIAAIPPAVRPTSLPTAALRSTAETLLREGSADESFPVKPQRAIADLRLALGPADVVTSDVGAHKLWLARIYPACEPRTVLISNGLAAMGFGLPAAIAVKLAAPQRQVVAVCGDGGFLMTSQEIETARRLRVPIVVMIWVDGSYSLIGWKEEQRFGREFGVHFTNPDFRRLAEAYGLPGFSIERTADLLPTLRRALALDQPSLVAVPIDRREHQRLVKELGAVLCPV